MRKTLSSRCNSSRSAMLSASRYVITGMRGSVQCRLGVRRAGTALVPRAAPRTRKVSVAGRAGVLEIVARRVDEHVGIEMLGRGLGALVREIPRVLHDRLQLLVQLRDLLLGYLVALLHVRAKQGDRVALEVFVELVLRAICAAHRIRHGVAHEAVRADFEQRGDLVRACPLDRLTHGGRTAKTSCPSTWARGMS